MEVAALDKVRATLASAGFRGWRLEWTARGVYQRVLHGEPVAVVSLRWPPTTRHGGAPAAVDSKRAQPLVRPVRRGRRKPLPSYARAPS